MEGILANSYYSGAGLLDIGLEMAGIKIQQSFEIDPIACATQRLNFRHDIVQSDITQKLVRDELECHLMAATYPCTKYAPIAAISGTLTGDDLFLHFFRHIAIRRPEMYIVENVPGMKRFPVVMEAMSQLPGYYVKVFCPINAIECGLPQDRKRLILIGSRRPFTWRKPENTRQITLKEILEDDPQVKITKSVINRLNGKYRDLPIISNPATGDLAPTCVAHYSKDKSTTLVVDPNSDLIDPRSKNRVRPWTSREYANLQGVPRSFKFAGTDNQMYKQVGNGVPVNMGIWLGTEANRYFGRKQREIGFERGAYITHHARTKSTEEKILQAISDLRQRKKLASKVAVAKIVGISREQVSRRYSHLFNAA